MSFIGFVFLTTNSINGMKYIGKRHGNPLHDTRYIGSGKFLKEDIAKYGRENFKRETLDVTSVSAKDLVNLERWWIAQSGAVESKWFYNVSPGEGTTRGNTGKFKGQTWETRTLFDRKGIAHTFTDFVQFCDTHRLNRSRLLDVFDGKIEHHKGWSLNGDCRPRRLDAKIEETKKTHVQKRNKFGIIHGRSKSISLIDPSGQIHEVNGISNFCVQNGLNPSKISELISGNRPHHKGWRLSR
ncbi:Seg-like homing endonuclease protein [Rhizobium phage RHph_Y68]|uniref:Seg-like homing endonuclease protein n=1 Tax=Rhizobium phage RHph_Y68 TaxID=2509787 RepID=A0A7S5USW8_9CAUD|nr:homing endonuclease [Rhizobium phage RHph_Y68]QIG68019.1 Seg-like homing endonuclease protein [Rhizobium phage RHph_Y68]